MADMVNMSNKRTRIIVAIIIAAVFIVITFIFLNFNNNNSGINGFLSSIGMNSKSTNTMKVVMPLENSGSSSSSSSSASNAPASPGVVQLFYVSGQAGQTGQVVSNAQAYNPNQNYVASSSNVMYVNNNQNTYSNSPSYNSPSSSSSNYIPQANHYVDIKNYEFFPATLTIGVGESVAFVNEDSVTHTVTTYHVYELDSPRLSPGDSYIHTFNTPGTYSYQCSIHSSMKGTIIVENSGNQVQNYNGNYNSQTVYTDNSNSGNFYSQNSYNNGNSGMDMNSMNYGNNENVVYVVAHNSNNQNNYNNNQYQQNNQNSYNNNRDDNNHEMNSDGNVLTAILSSDLPNSDLNLLAGEGFRIPIASIHNSVDINHFAFYPLSKIIEKGSSVTWINEDQVSHTVTSDSGNELGSGILAPGDSYTHTFNSAGNFYYHCSIHNSMKGLIIVSDTQITSGHIQFLGNQQYPLRG
jgi:plastocyanin